MFGNLTQTGITTSLKLYVSPFNEVMPRQVDAPPFQTECVKSQMSTGSYPHTPWSWMEGVRAYGVTYDTPLLPGPPPVAAGQININAVDMAFRLVTIARTTRAEMSMPSLSSLAATLRSFLDSDLTANDISRQRALQPVRFQRDLQSLAQILNLSPQDPASYYDEAPLLRLALLQMTMVTATHVQNTSACVQQTFANCVPSAAPVLAWADLPADNTAGKQSPNVAAGTVNMCAMALDVFTQCASGAWENRHAQWIGVPVNRCVIVPVLSSWSGAEWLIPYILSFTTTAWWNFSRTVTFGGVRPRSAADNIDHAVVRGLVEACTVVVPGQTPRIILVVVDANTDTYGPNGVFWIRNVPALTVPLFTGQVAGVNDNAFATRAYTWLGRMGNNPGTTSSLNKAWEALCTMVAMPGMPRRVMTMAAELAFTRPLPFTVTPGQLDAGARRFDGPWALGAEAITIDGTNMRRWDTEKHVEADARSLLRAVSAWGE